MSGQSIFPDTGTISCGKKPAIHRFTNEKLMKVYLHCKQGSGKIKMRVYSRLKTVVEPLTGSYVAKDCLFMLFAFI